MITTENAIYNEDHLTIIYNNLTITNYRNLLKTN